MDIGCRIKQRLRYEQGQLFWLNGRHEGRRAGSITTVKNYRCRYIKLYYHIIPEARVIWFLHHDEWPAEGMVVDHINEDSLDNNIDNLQVIPHKDNLTKSPNFWATRRRPLT